MLNNIKTKASERGFTIIELLIVIVIIAILAAITLVAYNSITARGRTAAEQGTASQAQQKIEAYNADNTAPTSGYPATAGALTGASSSATYAMSSSSVTFSTTSTGPAAPANNGTNTVWYYGTATGGCLYYWNYASSPATSTLQASIGTPATACPATAPASNSIGTSPNNMSLIAL